MARSDLERGGDRPGGEPGAGATGSEAWLWQRARELAAAGGRRRRVVVSRGSAPALVVADEDAYVVTTPELSTVDSRGSGDAMTAALATGLAEGRPLDDLLRRASAAGASNAVHKGSATPDVELVDRLAGAVEVREAGAVRAGGRRPGDRLRRSAPGG